LFDGNLVLLRGAVTRAEPHEDRGFHNLDGWVVRGPKKVTGQMGEVSGQSVKGENGI